MLHERAAGAEKMSVSHLEQSAQDVWEGALNEKLVAVQHQLHLAIVPSRLPDKCLDLVRQLNLHAIPLFFGGSSKVPLLWEELRAPSTISEACRRPYHEECTGPNCTSRSVALLLPFDSQGRYHHKRCGVLMGQLYLGQPVQNADDGLCSQPNADCGIQRVWREHILMHALWAAHRLCYGNQKVVRLTIHWGECLQEDAPVWTHPQRPAEHATARGICHMMSWAHSEWPAGHAVSVAGCLQSQPQQLNGPSESL